jgi:serpin B
MYRMIVAPVVLIALAAAARAADVDPPVDPTAAVKGNAAFALDLYGHLRGQEGNLFFSPYSISTALAMTRAGAKGETADQMDKTLHFTLPQERLNAAFGMLSRQINAEPAGKKRGYQLTTANALWAQKGYPFKPDYFNIVKADYGAGLNDADFAGATEEARQTINGWVEKQTNDKIKDLLPKGILTANTRLVLTNAIYFKGDWASQFKEDATKDEPFHVRADKTTDTPMMHQKMLGGYFDGGSFQMLEMPYAGKDLSMVVLLPKKVDGLADLEKDLTADKLAGWDAKLRDSEVVVSLPKFKTTQQMSMSKILSDMGMPVAFSDEADFSGIGGKPGDLRITDVVHKAYVDVNEEGTEAAAATGVVVGVKSLPAPTPEFQADHPFLFLIVDRRNGSILFLGRLADPTK